MNVRVGAVCLAVMAVSVVGTARAYTFEEDFGVADPNGGSYGVDVEVNSTLSHRHGWVEDGAYWIPVEGNKHLLSTPALRDFHLEADCEYVRSPSSPLATVGMFLHFRYDRKTRRGNKLEIYHDARHRLHIVIDGRELFVRQDAEPVSYKSPLTLDVTGSSGRLSVYGATVDFAVDGTEPGRGSVGFDLTFNYSVRLQLDRVRLTSGDPLVRTPVGSWRFVLPRSRGFVSAPVYDVTVSRYAGGETEVEGVLSGMLPDHPERKPTGGNEWCTLIDRLTDPYVRILDPDGKERRLLFWNGTKQFKDPQMKHVPPVAWPAKVRALCRDFPDDFAVAAGYGRAIAHPWRFAANGPFEQVQARDGTVLREGQAVTDGVIAFAATSPVDKRIVSLVPADLPERERALGHARREHYFFESEPVRFSLETTWRPRDFDAAEVTVRPRLETVYGDKTDVGVMPDGAAKAEYVGAGFVRSVRSYALEKNPGVGVWHLEVEVGAGAAEDRRSERVIFEVLPDDPNGPCPPLASGLPEFVSMPNEIKYLEESAFDPWGPFGGIGHYYAIDMRYPMIGERLQAWRADHLYRRKYFTWSWVRNSDDFDMDDDWNRRLMRHADYFGGWPNGKHYEGRFDLTCDYVYAGKQFEVMEAYLKERGVSLPTLPPEKMAECRKRNAGLTAEQFRDLVEHVDWNDFKAYAGRERDVWIQAFVDRLLAENPKLARAGYGPLPTYTFHYKSPYTLEHNGHPVEKDPRIRANGSFWLLEDYHYSCDYSLSRPAYFVAGYCLLHPQARKVYPEIYYEGWEPCMDGAVYLAHPGRYPKLAFSHQRRVAYQFAFATPFLRADGTFGFWKDDGFHARNPEKGAMDEFVYAWGKILKNRPATPLKAPFVISDPDAFRRHGEFYERDGILAYVGAGYDKHRADMNNTAEEDVGYAHERLCAEGYATPVVATLAALDRLTPGNCELAVLPPLVKGTPADVINAVRRAHARGVNLMCFEEAEGLGDLFDLLGEEVFARRETETGRTVFVKTPPTMVERSTFTRRYSRGRDTVSARIPVEMREAFAWLMPQPAVKSEHSHIQPAVTENGDIAVVLSEESPIYGDATDYPVTFRFTVSAPGIGERRIEADAPYAVVSRASDRVVLRTSTAKDTALFFKFSK